MMEKHYSIEKIREIAGGDEDFMVIVAQTFLEEIPPDINSLKEAIEADNKKLTYQFTHKMKPNFEMFGIDVLKEVADIEAWTKTSKNKSIINHKFEALFNVVTIVFKELKEDFEI